MDAERELARWAHLQLGLVTRAQALAAGLSSRQVLGRIDSGRWHAVRRGVYAGGWVPPSREQAVLAVVLAVGSPCVASCATAGRLWGLAVPVPDAIEVLTPRHRRVALEGVLHRRTEHFFVADLTTRRRIPVTSAARTLVDCAALLSPDSLGRALDEALRRKVLDLAELAACEQRLRSAGRRGLRTLREVLTDRLPGAQPPANDWERGLAKVLRRGGLPAPVHQWPVDVGGRRRFLDLAYPAERIGIEFDGFAEHGLVRTTFDDDRLRDNDLRLAGWLVLHFTSRSTPTVIVDTVDRAFRQRRSA